MSPSAVLRRTRYADELARATVKLPHGNEGRIEKLFIKESQQVEIRFSWWQNGRMMARPLDLTEEELLTVLRNAIDEDAFSGDFRATLKELL